MKRLALAAFALSVAAALAAPSGAQTAGDDARRAEALDRALGAHADPPRAPAVNAPALTWPMPPSPAWLAGQPYRQQPLLTGVPPGGSVGPRVRGSGAP